MHPPIARFITPMNQTLQVESGPRRLLTTLQAFMLCVWMLMAPPGRAVTTTTTYTLPAALTSSPFNCTLTNGTYVCGSINLDKDAELKLTSDVDIWVKNGSFTSQKNLTTNNGGHTLSLSVDSYVTMQKDTDIDMNITASGSVSFAKNARIDGNITSSSNITFAKDSTVNGNVIASGNLTGAKNVIINGSCIVAGTKSSITCTGGSAALHHVRVTTTGTTTACGTTPVTITACNSADSNGTCTPYTGGISGTLNADALDDSDLVSVGFSISSGNSSVTVSLPTISTAQTASLSFSNLSKTASTQGTCWNGSTNTCDLVVAECGIHHLRLNHGGAGVTCVPASVTINACSTADSSGSCTASTAGISGNVVASTSGGTQITSVPFTIAAGSSSTTVSVPVTTVLTATLGTSGLSSTTTNATTCWTGSTTSCDYTFADSGFVFDIPNHLAGTTQSIPFAAVKKADNSNACQPTLPDGDYDVDFSCNYSDPSSGTKNITVSNSDTTLSQSFACNTGTITKLKLRFASGVTAIKATYPDAGQVKLAASYTGANTGTITGNDFFIAAPTRFAISTTTSPLKADAAFTATVTAVNSSGAATPNFGKESNGHRATLTFSKCGGAKTGIFGGNLNISGLVNVPDFTSNDTNGVADGASTVTGLKYSEVGTLDATATMTSSGYATPSTYMSTGYSVTGTTNTQSGSGCSGSFGTFVPDHLMTTLDPVSTKFAYSGVPFKVVITGKNASNVTTENYTQDFAKTITLSTVDASGNTVASTVGTWSPMSLANTAFGTSAGGTASTSLTFTFPPVTGGVNATKLPPQTIYLRAVDATNGVSSASGSNPSTYEAKVEMRYGRLRLFNTYGSSLSTVKMPVQAEYWNGTVWVVNADDSTTSIPAGSIGFPSGGTVSASYTGSAVKMSLGKGTITIASSSNAKGYAYVTTHLGAALGAANACPTNATRISGANLAGLRSYHGCEKSGAYDYDPTARASFGIQSQETKGVVHVREVFN